MNYSMYENRTADTHNRRESFFYIEINLKLIWVLSKQALDYYFGDIIK